MTKYLLSSALLLICSTPAIAAPSEAEITAATQAAEDAWRIARIAKAEMRKARPPVNLAKRNRDPIGTIIGKAKMAASPSLIRSTKPTRFAAVFTHAYMASLKKR